ncbi:MAG: NAD(P)-binding protein [Woeseiaceae bacterium]|nr:NAD(P)-binding protein [Woeseiaceae bacterium]NNL46656.1 NAD(P)-binding protein [Woeseiaceae bacterium]
MTKVAVIGAGLSGLVVARELESFHSVTVFEKSSGVGGRMATRYADGFEFDHGAQFFTARSPDFRHYLQPMIERGVVAIWRARFAELDRGTIVSQRDWDNDYPHYVGAPRMNEIGKHLAADLDVRRNTTVSMLEREPGGWCLRDSGRKNLGHFDWVVLTMPAAQTAALAPDGSDLHEYCKSVRMRACFALMLGFDAPLPLPWQAALVRGADISWVSVNSSKPGRPEPFSLVVHSTNAFADANISGDLVEIAARLRTETGEVLGESLEAATFYRQQRWRYANADNRDGADFFVDESVQLAACGDWFNRGRVEAAFTSGFGLAQELKGVALR